MVLSFLGVGDPRLSDLPLVIDQMAQMELFVLQMELLLWNGEIVILGGGLPGVVMVVLLVGGKVSVVPLPMMVSNR